MSRGFSALVGATVLCAAVAGCTTTDPERRAADPSPTAASPSASSTPAKPVTLTLAVYGPEDSLDAYDDLAEAFVDDNPDVKVRVERHSSAEELLADVADGDAPDVFLMDHQQLPALLEQELVQPVDALLEARTVDFGDGYQRSGLTAFSADAALQCMPHDVSPLVVYYNQELIDLEQLAAEDEDPPNAVDGWNWETFTTAALMGARGRAHGLYVEPSLMSLAPFVWSRGGEIVDDVQDPTTLTFSDDETVEALELILPLLRDPAVTPNQAQLERMDAVTRFTEGRLGMIVGTRALTPGFRDSDVDFEVMPLPRVSGRFRTVSDMTGYCISADTEHTEAAGDLLAFAVSREGAMITTSPGYVVPANLEVANSPVFIQGSRQPENSFIFNEGVRRTQPLPFTPQWSELNEAVDPSIHEMFNAPVIELQTLVEEIDTTSQQVLAPDEPVEQD